MATSIKLKKSSISGRIPSSSDLEYGEIAINYADGILYFKNSSNQVSSINARAIGVDSTATFSIIDSSYIEARVGSTSNIAEGTNLYYTSTRADSDAKNAISVTDAGGDGSLTYNPTTGVLTYTGPSASEVRAHITANKGVSITSGEINLDSANVKAMFSAAGDLTYNSSTGQFSFDVESVYTADNFDSDYILAKDSANTAVERNKHDATTKNFSVTVASKTADHVYNGQGSGQGYVIDGTQSPIIQLQIGRKYRFTLSSSDMSSHPFRFYYDAAKTTQYTTDVLTASTYAEIEITESTPPVLHYQCSAHGYMGHALVIGTRNLTGFTTSNLTEGSNQYYTEARVQSLVDSSYVQLRQSAIVIADSNDVINIVDSAYVQARQVDLQRDSAFTTNIVDSAYIQARQINNPTGVDSSATIALIDSSYVQNRQIKYTNNDFADSAFVTTQINNLIDAAPGALNTLNELAAAIGDDANFSTTITNSIAAKLDSAEATALIDSAYIQARQINNPTGVDSAATIALVDSAYVQARQINNPSGVDSAATIALIDSAYVQSRQSTTGTTDSAAVSAIIIADVDSAYVQARQSSGGGGSGTTDSAAVLALIDSSHVQGKFSTLRESDNTLIVSGNIIPATDSSFSIGTAEKKFKDIHLSGGTVFIDNLALSADSATRTISIGQLDSAGVINVVGVIATVDSAGVSAIVDSAFLEARLQSFVSDTELAAFNYSTFDSTSAINLIDSSYVQARQTASGTTDSAAVIDLIDSAYVQARQSLGNTGITVQEEGSSLTTAGSTLNFVGPNITASGTGAVKTITVAGGLDSSAGIELINNTVNQTYINNKLGVDYGGYIVNATNALDILLASVNVDYGSPTAPAGLKSNYGAI